MAVTVSVHLSCAEQTGIFCLRKDTLASRHPSDGLTLQCKLWHQTRPLNTEEEEEELLRFHIVICMKDRFHDANLGLSHLSAHLLVLLSLYSYQSLLTCLFPLFEGAIRNDCCL